LKGVKILEPHIANFLNLWGHWKSCGSSGGMWSFLVKFFDVRAISSCYLYIWRQIRHMFTCDPLMVTKHMFNMVYQIYQGSTWDSSPTSYQRPIGPHHPKPLSSPNLGAWSLEPCLGLFGHVGLKGSPCPRPIDAPRLRGLTKYHMCATHQIPFSLCMCQSHYDCIRQHNLPF
jgi:hypothetical protein